ncbi:hypothetical protein [Luteimicrobium subarcticum]|uniref:Integral membrane protein n=1 Tax=Luteimicrobium subarcticum TaxID=620910 RepID=A0A2M8WV71_9MICO|nr:hypothetical protein [Luteimicrobium subarcticum]PJI94819.1 hypothetical protein CLV34_0667 [Luteimicrobium subarcticum]
MKILVEVFAVLHFIGWAIVLGGYLVSIRKPGLPKGVFHGAATALVSGIVMMGVIESNPDVLGHPFPDGKLAVKLVVALVITVLAFLVQRKGDRAPAWMKHAVGGLTIANIVIAVFW